jgi:hypothetical protein
MPTPTRVPVTLAELTINIRIWLTVVGQRRADILRNLWTRRGEDYDGEKIKRARHDLADHLAERILYGDHELTRPALPQDDPALEIIPVHERHRDHDVARRASSTANTKREGGAR